MRKKARGGVIHLPCAASRIAPGEFRRSRDGSLPNVGELRRLTRGDRVIELTRTEFGLLELLLRNAEQVISYDVIRERVWGYGEAPASNALQVFVGFLRRKLEDGGGPRLLHNVRGVGYVIRTAP